MWLSYCSVSKIEINMAVSRDKIQLLLFSGLKVKKCWTRTTGIQEEVLYASHKRYENTYVLRKMKTNEKCYARGLTRSTHTTLAIL